MSAPTDNIAATIAGALAEHINYDHLATLIAQKLQAAQKTAAPDTSPLIEVKVLRHQLGRHGRPMATITFEANFITPGLIKYVPGPDSRMRYVEREAWEKVVSETKKATRKNG